MENYVVCLKWGNKYSPSYVNTLKRMVKRNLTLPYEFVCFTEDNQGLDSDIKVLPLPMLEVIGWWHKVMMFDPNLPLKGNILFLDLDVVIFKNIDNLFHFKPNSFCIIRDFNRHVVKNYNKFNSSVFRLTTGQHSNVYTDFKKNTRNTMKRYPGDQDWLRASINSNYNYWPEEWIQSYKWEMRGKPKFDKMPKGKRDFEMPGDPVIKDTTSIAVFHGDPNPHNCKDPWVIENWK